NNSFCNELAHAHFHQEFNCNATEISESSIVRINHVVIMELDGDQKTFCHKISSLLPYQVCPRMNLLSGPCSSMSIFRISPLYQLLLYPDIELAMYSASIVLKATQDCFLENHDIGFPQCNTIHPLTLFLSISSPAQSASEKQTRLLEFRLKLRPRSWVPFKYLSTLLVAFHKHKVGLSKNLDKNDTEYAISGRTVVARYISEQTNRLYGTLSTTSPEFLKPVVIGVVTA
ncbi:hypothetical protein, partial [Klebsiella pneumoniae]|uniref:hypothetical protein n=1 Tax=Klebsiella pneumoniae TaxID=573 RepID=UPI0040553AE3